MTESSMFIGNPATNTVNNGRTGEVHESVFTEVA